MANVPAVLDDVKKVASRSGRNVLPVFVVYNLPNRDCSAEIVEWRALARGRGRAALSHRVHRSHRRRVRGAPVAAHRRRPGAGFIAQPGLEPRHLQCALSQHVYKHSVAYAIARLSLPNVFIYLDSAHAGWLGWDGNRAKMVDVVKDTLMLAGGLDRIRGFATNVSNYTPLDEVKKASASSRATPAPTSSPSSRSSRKTSQRRASRAKASSSTPRATARAARARAGAPGATWRARDSASAPARPLRPSSMRTSGSTAGRLRRHL